MSVGGISSHVVVVVYSFGWVTKASEWFDIFLEALDRFGLLQMRECVAGYQMQMLIIYFGEKENALSLNNANES